MTNSVLSINSLINVEVNLGTTSAQSQSLSNLLIVGTSDVIDVSTRIRNYTSLAEVVVDFGTTAPEYLAAQVYFAQSPTPNQLSIGRWAKTASAGILIGAVVSPTDQILSTWTSITNGSFNIALNGGSVTPVGPINFSTATNLNGVATLIQNALATASLSATVLWNSSNQQFTIESSVTGTSSSVSFLTAPSTGTDISAMLSLTATSSGAYTVNGIAAESALAAATLFDINYGQTYYGYFQIGTSDTDVVNIAEYIQGAANKHLYFVNTSEGGVLVSTDTSNVAYLLKQLKISRTVVQYSAYNVYAVLSFAAKLLSVDYTANQSVLTMMYKQEPTVTAESINQNQLAALTSFNCNVFVNYNNGAAIIQNGVVSSGDYVDIIAGTDWLSLFIQNTCFNLLYTSNTKIPQTDPGNGILKGGIVNCLDQSVTNGLVAPGIWDQAGFGVLKQGQRLPTGYYVYQPSVDLQAQVDREARKSVTFQVAAKLAGAIQTVSVILNINR